MDETQQDIDYIVWDLETSGLSPFNDRILEIGCMVVTGDVVEHKHWVLKNEGLVISEFISNLTGITQEIVDKEGREPRDCFKEFLPLFKRCKKNITHNGMRFDIEFLVGQAGNAMGWFSDERMAVTNLIRSTAYDTAVYYKAKVLDLEPEFRESYTQYSARVMSHIVKGLKYNLALVCDELGVPRDGIVQHRAMADVHLTHEIYKKIHGI